ncbi:putative transmembrane protein 184A [Trypanosoma grayi]|uniref:putative transmembrane protein 184A n=1 Tax=Trypanosoma grayi TaxID=71804 RepID=UPI0004F442A0|nr:putative transmembrane protein 184A [Trypanosoma grayi]KEG10027.1 putative transmembrane protein 184A [Trypanosoma grayi]
MSPDDKAVSAALPLEQQQQRQRQGHALPDSGCPIVYRPSEVDGMPIDSQQQQQLGLQDCFHGKDGRVTPCRRPEIVDRMHLLFFLLSVPVVLTIVGLFIVLYIRADVGAYKALCWISGVASFAALGMTGLLVLCHLTAYTCPSQQRLICRIILLVPVYAMDSLIALLIYRAATIVALIRDTYEAYVIYQFYFLLMEYLEGEERVLYLWSQYGTGDGYIELEDDDNEGESKGVLRSSAAETRARRTECTRNKREGEVGQQKPQVNEMNTSGGSRTGVAVAEPTREKTPETNKSPRATKELELPLLSSRQQSETGMMPTRFMPHVFPMNYFLAPIPLNAGTLFLWKLFLTQYMIVNPLLTLVTVPLYFNGYYHDGFFYVKDFYPYFALVRTISVTFALTALVYFYFATKAYMQVYSPTVKFLAIKAVVFLTFWQGVLLSVLVFYNVIPDTHLFSAKEFAAALQNILICLEMYVVSIAHRWVFNDDIYLRSSNGQRLRLHIWAIRHVLSISDVIDEAGSVVRMAPRTAERMIRQRLAHWRRRTPLGSRVCGERAGNVEQTREERAASSVDRP